MSFVTDDKTGSFEKNPESYVDEDFVRFFRKRAEAEDKSVFVVPKDLAREILTEKRLEIIQVLRDKEVESKRDLARKLDRDIKSVSRDLDILWNNSVINYSEESNRKIPELSADKIIIEPL